MALTSHEKAVRKNVKEDLSPLLSVLQSAVTTNSLNILRDAIEGKVASEVRNAISDIKQSIKADVEASISDVIESLEAVAESSVPNIQSNLDLLQGAAGTGKTTVVLRLLAAALTSSIKKKVLVCSSTNAAVNNICRHAEAENANEDFLYVRLHPEELERETLRRHNPSQAVVHSGFEPANSVRGGTSSGKKSKQREKYHDDGSLARRVLQVAGAYDTNCMKLIELRQKHWELGYILRKP